MKKTVTIASILSVILIFMFAQQYSQAQAFQINGTVRNDATSAPLPNANIRVYGTKQGTSTDKEGQFSLQLAKIPATIVISCIGYDRAVYDILEKSTSQLRILLRPVMYELKEVEISPANHTAVYEDKTFSVLDYELMEDHVALLVFRNALQRAVMVMLDRGGDTLAVSALPELPPQLLCRDFLSNVHYYSRSGMAYQCYFNQENQSLDFLHPISIDSLEKYVMPYLFQISERLYFQEKVLNGFGSSIAYYSKDGGKQYIKNCMNEKKISEYHDDMEFYLRWNGAIGSYVFPEDDIESEDRFNFSIPLGEGGSYGKNEARAHQFEFYNMTYPLFKLSDDTLVFFNFGSDLLELLDPDGTVIATAPISFHKGSTGVNPLANNDRVENEGWRWGTRIINDEATHALYAMFIRSGMVMIRRINLSTGNLGAGTIIPLPFPEKIKLYKGEAFFLCKETGNNENWKLLKCNIQ